MGSNMARENDYIRYWFVYEYDNDVTESESALIKCMRRIHTRQHLPLLVEETLGQRQQMQSPCPFCTLITGFSQGSELNHKIFSTYNPIQKKTITYKKKRKLSRYTEQQSKDVAKYILADHTDDTQMLPSKDDAKHMHTSCAWLINEICSKYCFFMA